ncbi:hypothetical protein [Streptomyces sp. NPDC050428]|uniref:hypothetical protein n=1 Tax=Streptomyces sp. NPDC050428 TaxID=3155757 RepID=UPI003414E3F1
MQYTGVGEAEMGEEVVENRQRHPRGAYFHLDLRRRQGFRLYLLQSSDVPGVRRVVLGGLLRLTELVSDVAGQVAVTRLPVPVLLGVPEGEVTDALHSRWLVHTQELGEAGYVEIAAVVLQGQGDGLLGVVGVLTQYPRLHDPLVQHLLLGGPLGRLVPRLQAEGERGLGVVVEQSERSGLAPVVRNLGQALCAGPLLGALRSKRARLSGLGQAGVLLAIRAVAGP